METVTILVSKDLCDRLKEFGKEFNYKDESFDFLINKIMDDNYSFRYPPIYFD